MLNLPTVIRRIQSWAPLSIASPGGWDNVGLLSEPSRSYNHTVKNIFLTIDLTERTLNEAIESANADLIIAYHPPIFRPKLSALRCSDPLAGDQIDFENLNDPPPQPTRQLPHIVKTRILVTSIEKQIPIYSPHTTWDCIRGGITDWLATGLAQGSPTHHICEITPHPNAAKSPNLKGAGEGRQIFFPEDHAISLHQLINRVKSHLNLSHVRVALPAFNYIDLPDHPLVRAAEQAGRDANHSLDDKRFAMEANYISGIACCCGAGGPVLSASTSRCDNQPNGEELDSLWDSTADPRPTANAGGHHPGVMAWVTGEMSHHDVIAATSQGIAVILCEHSNTERGFLRFMAESILPGEIFTDAASHDMKFIVSETDSDPLSVV